jgi:3-oxoacyl-[acyl-carrier protein] reductase
MATSSTSLEGRTALVCGASKGLGRAIALALAARGAGIIALARRAEALDALLPLLREAGAPTATALVADLDDQASLPGLVAGLKAQILIHNTGGPPSAPLLEESPDRLTAAFGRHVISAQLLVQALLPAMREAGYGRIVTILSTSVREPIEGLGASNVVRGAMASWSKTLSRELPPGITINNVLPGYHDTSRLTELKEAISARTGRSPEQIEADWLSTIPEGRLGDPADLAELVAYLCSPAGGYVRGTSIAVDGGRTRSL